MRIVIFGLMGLGVSLMVVPALVGWWSHGPIDALGWANYILLGLKLGLGGLGVAYFFWTRERTDSEA